MIVRKGDPQPKIKYKGFPNGGRSGVRHEGGGIAAIKGLLHDSSIIED